MTEKSIRDWDGDSETPTVNNRNSLHKNISTVVTSFRIKPETNEILEVVRRKQKTKSKSATIDYLALYWIEAQEKIAQVRSDPQMLADLKKASETDDTINHIVYEMPEETQMHIFRALEREFRKKQTMKETGLRKQPLI